MAYRSSPPKKKFYVVWKGRKTGIFNNWDEASAQVNGYTGAEYKAFESKAEAENALQGEYRTYKGKSPPPARKTPAIDAGQPLKDSYCVDAASSGNPGLLEWRCVQTSTRKQVFHQGPFKHGTNNVGEFLAIVQALAYFKEKSISLPIYSDSANAMLWVKAKKCKTKLARNALNAPLFDLIARAEAWLANNSYENKVLKWNTRAWGEIPADFGRK